MNVLFWLFTLAIRCLHTRKALLLTVHKTNIRFSGQKGDCLKQSETMGQGNLLKMSNQDGSDVPLKKESDIELIPNGPKQRAQCREKEEKSPMKQSDLSKQDKKEKIGNNGEKQAEKKEKSGRKGTSSSRTTLKQTPPAKPSAGKQEDRSKISLRNEPMKPFTISLSKDEADITALQLEDELLRNARLMEELKIALHQIYITFMLMIKRGNGSTDNEMVKSERGQAAAEKLNREVVQTENFWKTETKLQPAMNIAIAKNTVYLAQAERTLQDNGPGHMKKIKRFLFHHYPRYVDMKRSLMKLVKAKKSGNARDSYVTEIAEFVKTRYLNYKDLYLAEIECVFAEFNYFHYSTSFYWSQIAERKVPKVGLQPDTFDYKLFGSEYLDPPRE